MKSFRSLSHKGLALGAALLLVLSALSLFTSTAHALDKYSASYTVRLYSGAQGTFDEKASAAALANVAALSSVKIDYKADTITISGIPAVNPSDSNKPYRISFTPGMVKVTNGKYLVRGIRESGKDNNTISAANFAVTKDLDLVVGYYIANGAVSYTINYVDENGNQIAPSETHYGNAGEQLVLAFPYVEGYRPGAYNGVVTLKANAADNVFNFPYTAIPEPETTTTAAASSSQAASSAASSSASETETDENGNPVTPTSATDENGNEIPPTSATDENGNEIPASSGSENESSGGENETSGSENESGSEEASGTENETTGSEGGSSEEATSDIPETMTIEPTTGPAASTVPEPETGSAAQKILNFIKHPGFIFGSLGGLTGLILLILFLVKNKKKKNG